MTYSVRKANISGHVNHRALSNALSYANTAFDDRQRRSRSLLSANYFQMIINACYFEIELSDIYRNDHFL